MENPWDKYKKMASDFVDTTKGKITEVAKDAAVAIRDSGKGIIPISGRQFIYDLVGGTEDVTEKSLSEQELGAAREAVQRSFGRGGSSSITYDDLTAVGVDPESDIGGAKSNSMDWITKAGTDPRYAMKTLLGRADYFVNDKNEVIIRNKYDFNDALEGFDLATFVREAKDKGLDPYAQLRNLAKHAASGPDDPSSMMEINLGMVKGIDKEKWLRQGGNLRVQVLKGETLGGIAKKYGLSTQELADYNDIKDPNKIKVSQTLRVPQVSNKEPKTPARESTIKPAPPPVKVAGESMIVKSGDTLSAIAKANNTTVAELASLNNIKDVNKIRAGQSLVLPKG